MQLWKMNKIKKIFVNQQGSPRVGWRLALGISAYAAAFYGAMGLLSLAFGKLFEAWGITNVNLIYAPRWAQWIVAVHADAIYVAAYTVALLAGMALARRWTPAQRSVAKETGKGALLGVAPGLVLTFAAFLLDSMRLENPLTEPAVSYSQVTALAVLLMGSLSGEVLTKRLIFDPMRSRYGRWGGVLAVLLMSVLLSGSWSSGMGLITTALMGLAGCVLYERGGLMASAALTAGWSAWTAWLFAWPNTTSACVYRMYTVSEVWLTGGNAGAARGFGSMLLWAMIAAILLRKEMKRGIVRMKNMRRSTNGKDSHCDRRSGFKR